MAVNYTKGYSSQLFPVSLIEEINLHILKHHFATNPINPVLSSV